MTRPTRAELAAERDEMRSALEDIQDKLDEVLGDDGELDEAEESDDDEEEEEG